MTQTFGERLRQLRNLVSLPARELDRLAGLGEGHTSLIEGGSRANVGMRTATSIARVLGVSLDWLANGVGRPPTERAVRAAVETAREEKGAA